MRYNGMPAGMWMLFKKSFQRALINDLGYKSSDAKRISKAARPRYREIIEKLPEFEKEDRFKGSDDTPVRPYFGMVLMNRIQGEAQNC